MHFLFLLVVSYFYVVVTCGVYAGGFMLFNVHVKYLVSLVSYHGNFLCLCMKYQKDGGSVQDVEIKEVMDTWTLQMGYPVVTVTQSGNHISATQQRFLFNPHSNFTEEFTSPYGLVLLHVSIVLVIVSRNTAKNKLDGTKCGLNCSSILWIFL